MKLRVSLLALSAVLIAAHFLRTASYVPMFFCLASPFLLFIKKRWTVLIVQALTVLAAVIWLLTLYAIIRQRMLEGRSWTVAAIILGVVTGYTLFTGWLLNSPVVKQRYPA
jgi:hypothetical protein